MSVCLSSAADSQLPQVDGMEAAALELLQLGPKAVLLKGGHLPGTETRTVIF